MAEPSASKGNGGSGENDGVNVQVLLRCRPLSDKEIAERSPQVISCNEALREVTLYQNAGGKQLSKTYRFDKVFSCEASQEKLYKQAIIPIVQEVMEGFNCTIFAYGQTGTGKTYTMEGGPRRSDDGKVLSAEAGVIPRSIKQIFDTIEDNNIDSTVKVTFLELYNEELTDLLSFDDAKDDKRLRLLETNGSGVVVQGLEEVVVKSAAEIYQVLDRGTAKRRTAETLLNKRSSRSHSVFTITIHMREATPEGEDVVKVGKLNLVDLAGSENISRSGAKDSRAREAGSINQSLLTLGRVITTLVEHSGHVPYRDSKLTRLLRESLGGKTKTCIIATVAPTVHCQEETISTLDYAHRAKNIRNKPEVNQKISKTAMIREMSSEMEKLRMELVAQREKNGVYIPAETHQQNELERIQLRDTVKALREEMKVEQEEHAQVTEQLKTELEQERTRREAEVTALTSERDYLDARLQETYRTIHERQYVIAAHRRAEQDVAEHAESIRSELSAAVSDIGELFASLSELSNVHSGDRSTFNSIQNVLKARLQEVSKSLSAATESQRQQLKVMSSALEAFKQQKQQDLEQLTARVASVQSMVASMKDAVVCHVEAADGTAAAALARAGEAGSAHVADAIAAAQALEVASSTAVDALAKSLEQQTQDLLSFAQQQAVMANTSCEALRVAMKRFTEDFSGLQATAEQSQDTVVRQTSELNAGLSGFVVRHKDAAAEKEQQLVAQIAALVRAFSEGCVSDVAREVQTFQQQVQDGSEVVKGQLVSISKATNTAIQGVKEAEVSLTSSIKSQQQGVEEYSAGLTSSLHGFGDQARAMHQDVGFRLGSTIAAAESFRQDLEQRCSAGTAAVKTSLRTCAEKAGEDASSTQGALTELSEALEASAASDSKSVDAWTETNSAVTTSIQGMDQKQGTSLSALDAEAGALIQERLAVQRLVAPPSQRDYKVPPASSIRELRCPPEEKLVARCHEEAPHIFAVPAVPTSAVSPRTHLVRAASEPVAACGENATPLPPQVCPGLASSINGSIANAAVAANGLVQSPRSSTAGLRSRIPSKPNLIPSSPSSAKDAPCANTRPLLADKTNSKQSILSEWHSG